MDIIKYNKDLAAMKFKGSRYRIYTLSSKIQGYKVFAEKNCVYIIVPKGSRYTYGLPEGSWLGHEMLILVNAEFINPALLGRE